MSNLRKDSLLWENFVLYQNPENFCFSLDAVILACFFSTKPRLKVLDAGTGNGVLPLLLTAKEPSLDITAIEIDEETTALAKKNMAKNAVNTSIIHGNMMESTTFLEKETFDAIISNPPYYKIGEGRLPTNPQKAMAQVEIAWDTPTFFASTYALLKKEGSLTLSYPKKRQEEVETIAKDMGFLLKRRLFLQSTQKKEPYLVLFTFLKTALTQKIKECTLTVYNEKGDYTDAMKTILEEKSCAI